MHSWMAYMYDCTRFFSLLSSSRALHIYSIRDDMSQIKKKGGKRRQRKKKTKKQPRMPGCPETYPEASPPSLVNTAHDQRIVT